MNNRVVKLDARVSPGLLVAVLLAGLVVGCVSVDADASPVSVEAAVTLASLDAVTESAPAGGDNITSPIEQILDYYPLAPGAIWTYQVTLDISAGQGPEAIEHWEGTIMLNVIEATLDGGVPIFSVERTAQPGTTLLDLTPRYFFVRDSGIYQEFSYEMAVEAAHGDVSTYSAYMTWPLALDEEWNGPHDDNFPGWFIAGQESVQVPAGMFDACLIGRVVTNPDHVLRWFCPGTGLVKYEYHHHGSVHDEIWELLSFSPGSS